MAVGVEAIDRASRPRRRGASRSGRFPTGSSSSTGGVPIGVVAVVYEARPNVTIDAAALCLKSGNAALLRGSSSAAASNAVLGGIVREAVAAAGMPEGTVEMVGGGGREELAELAGQRELVDLIIPARRRGPEEGARGGREGADPLRGVGQLPRLRRTPTPTSTWRRAIAFNAKVQRPGVCNAAETLLVHRDVAAAFLPAGAGGACRARASSSSATTPRASSRAAPRSAPRPRRTGTPSTTR